MTRARVKLSELDFNNVTAWPQHYKIGFCAGWGVLILILANLIVFRNQRDELEALKHQETLLRAEFTSKAGRAESLPLLRRQITEMDETLQQMLHKLPNKQEIPDLMVDISQIASSSGLNNELFQPGPEVSKTFFVEKPIALRMAGDYHHLGVFLSEVASLPHAFILTMHDISLQLANNDSVIPTDGRLAFSGTIKIYRYMDEDEALAQKKKGPDARSAGANR